MPRHDSLLLVTLDDRLAATVRELVQHYLIVRRAHTILEATSMLRPRSGWRCLVLDLQEAEDDPIPVMRQLRELDPLLPMLAVAMRAGNDVINAAHAARVELVVRPLERPNLVSFVRRALVGGWLPNERISAWVDEQARTHQLTARGVQLIAYALGGEPRPDIIARLGITQNTLKTQVRLLLRKFGARTMDGLANLALREALIMEGERRLEVLCNPTAELAAEQVVVH